MGIGQVALANSWFYGVVQGGNLDTLVLYSLALVEGRWVFSLREGGRVDGTQ